jgi:CRP-like cAMP-binding protein
MQIAGWGYRSPVECARREFALGGQFQELALSYVQTQLVQAMQSAGCNAKHEIHERLARWLLLCADRVQSERFRMPQQFLGDMLGCTRPTVSVAAKVLKDSGLIEYSRGVITIVDAAGLQRAACECYEVIRSHLEDCAEFVSGLAA